MAARNIWSAPRNSISNIPLTISTSMVTEPPMPSPASPPSEPKSSSEPSPEEGCGGIIWRTAWKNSPIISGSRSIGDKSPFSSSRKISKSPESNNSPPEVVDVTENEPNAPVFASGRLKKFSVPLVASTSNPGLVPRIADMARGVRTIMACGSVDAIFPVFIVNSPSRIEIDKLPLSSSGL